MVTNLKIVSLSKKLGDQQILDHINLHLESGQICGIVGHNGSGKSVLFKCISGLMIPDEGEIRYNDHLLKPGEILPNAGIIIEGPAYLKNETAYQNLKMLYRIKHKINKEYLFRILNMVKLEPESKKPMDKYSLGMKQRFAIAQAIIENPEILILDEPMNGLDTNGVQEIRELLLQMKKQNKLIILASHNKEDIAVLCDKVFRMEKGTLIQM